MKKISLIFLFLLSVIGFDSVFASFSWTILWYYPNTDKIVYSDWINNAKTSIPKWLYFYVWENNKVYSSSGNTIISRTLANIKAGISTFTVVWNRNTTDTGHFYVSKDESFIIQQKNSGWYDIWKISFSDWVFHSVKPTFFASCSVFLWTGPYWPLVLPNGDYYFLPYFGCNIWGTNYDGHMIKGNINDLSSYTFITNFDIGINIRANFSSDFSRIYFGGGGTDVRYILAWLPNQTSSSIYTSISKRSTTDGLMVLPSWDVMYADNATWPPYRYDWYYKNVSTGIETLFYGLSDSWDIKYSSFYNSMILPTCSDWIKNQDETAIDFWGVCGTGNVNYDEFGCINQSFVNPSDITWYSGLYAGTWSLVNPPIFTGSISAYYGTGADHDILMIYDYPFNLSAPDDKAFEYWLGRETYFEWGNIRTWSVRWWIDQQFNAVAIYWTWIAWRWVFKHSTDNSNMFTTVATSFNWSGAVYWIDSTALSNVFDGYYMWTVKWMILGKTNTFTNKKSCKNASYSCEWKQNGATSFSCIYPYSYELSDAENNAKCGIDNSWSCVPISGTGFALPWQTTITTASWEVISSSWDPPSSSKISAIFSCDKDNNLETTWQEYLTCITTVIDNAIEYVQKTQDETTRITSGVVLTKTWTSNPFDKGQVSTNNMLSALKWKAETQLVWDTKTSIFVKIFYWFAILLSIVMALLLFKKEK